MTRGDDQHPAEPEAAKWEVVQKCLESLDPAPRDEVTRAGSARDARDALRITISTPRERPRRGRRGVRLVARGALVALPVVAFATLLLLGPKGSNQRPAAEPAWEKFSILDRPQTVEDRVSLPFDGIDANSTRLAATVEGSAIYLARGSRSDATCLIIVVRPGGGESPRCWPDRALAFAGITTDGVIPRGGNRKDVVVGVAPDGIDWVQDGETRYPVKDNIFFGEVTGNDKPNFDLHGPTASAIRVGPIGGIFPQDSDDQGGQEVVSVPKSGFFNPEALVKVDSGPLPAVVGASLPLVAPSRGGDGHIHGEIDLAALDWLTEATLVFVTPGCPECIQAVQHAEQNQAPFGTDFRAFVVFVGSTKEAQVWVSEADAALPVVVDELNTLSAAFKVTTYPDTVSVNRHAGWGERRRGFAGFGEWEFPGYADEYTTPNGRATSQRGPSLKLSVLQQEASSIDEAVRRAAESDPAPPFGCGTDPRSLRPATQRDGIRVFVGRGTGGGTNVLVERAGMVALSCDEPGEVHRVFWVEGAGPGPWVMAGVVGDGFDQVEVAGRTVPVENNGFILTAAEHPAIVTFRGPGGTITLEDLAPGESNGIAEFYFSARLSQTKIR